MTGRIRFSGFELDPAAGELRKMGVRAPIAGQPLEALALLASRPGEVVAREELKNALWPEGTHIDFDDGLNTAIRRIRRALDDSATQPRFIETLPRRGYRFIGEIEDTGGGGEMPIHPPARARTWGGMRTLAAALATLVAVTASVTCHTFENGMSRRPQLASFVSRVTPLDVERRSSSAPDGSRLAFSRPGQGKNRLTQDSEAVRPLRSRGGRWMPASPAAHSEARRSGSGENGHRLSESASAEGDLFARPSAEEVARRQIRSAQRTKG